jgi:Mitoribosomal protein mL52
MASVVRAALRARTPAAAAAANVTVSKGAPRIVSATVSSPASFGRPQARRAFSDDAVDRLSFPPEDLPNVAKQAQPTATGPLHDLPDWRFEDGTPAPERQAVRRNRRKQVMEDLRKKELVAEMEEDLEAGNLQQWY